MTVIRIIISYINKKLFTFLSLIFLVAFGLRVWGIGFGLPYTYHIDESWYVTGALNLGAGEIDITSSGPGLINVLFLEYGGFYVIGRIFHLFNSMASFESYYRSDPTVFYLLGRLTTALLGSLTVLIVYGLGRRVYNRTVGWLAALFLALAFLHVRDSHFAVPDVAMTCLAALAVLTCIIAVQKKSLRYLLLAAAVGGLAVATKITAWPIVVTIGLSVYTYVSRTNTPQRLARFLGLSSLTGLVFLASFLIGGVEFILAPGNAINNMIMELTAGSGGGFSIWQVDTLPGWLFYLKTLTWGIGWGMLLAAILGLGLMVYAAARARNGLALVLLSFPALYYLVMGATRHYFARYALPLIPFLAIGAGYAVAWAATKIAGHFSPGRKWAVGALMAGLTLLLIAQPLAYSLRADDLLTRTDTRTLAKAWIEATLPEGAKIAVDWIEHTPPLATAERSVPSSQKTYQVVTPDLAGIFVNDAATYYRQNGFDYIIASSFISEIPLLDQDKQQQRSDFYAAMDQEYTLLATFRPNSGEADPPFIFDEIYGPAIGLWQRERPGPVIKIYAVQQP